MHTIKSFSSSTISYISIAFSIFAIYMGKIYQHESIILSSLAKSRHTHAHMHEKHYASPDGSREEGDTKCRHVCTGH